jgi:hypothetical protein
MKLIDGTLIDRLELAQRGTGFSKTVIVGAVGFEPTKPLACKASALPLSYAPLVAADGPRTWIEVSVPVFAAWPHPAGC